MPIITVASPRSGTGKSTAALLLALELARIGTVEIIDAGADGSLTAWAGLAPLPPAINGKRIPVEDLTKENIAAAAARARHVVIDLDAMKSPAAAPALAASDLVVIPTRERFDDVASMPSALAALRRAGEAAGREIPHAVLLSRRRDLPESHAARQMAMKLTRMEGVRLLAAALDETAVFASLLATGGDLRARAAREGEAGRKAIESAGVFAREALDLLGANMARGGAARPTARPRDETPVQFTVYGPRWIADEFRALCKADRRTHSDMLRILIEVYGRDEAGS